MASLEEAIKGEARRLGFDLAGITTPDPPAHFHLFERWLEAGYHGEMGYLANERSRQRRADPRQILPECRSILVLAMRYPASHPPEPRPWAQGQIASYAWGEDYHLVLEKRLQQLADFIIAQVGHEIPYRYYTDSGPILERELAQRAGLGWIGKNSCLIHPRYGSYLLLAELLLGLELQPDEPFPSDHCGRCTRCLEACPTACILPDRTLDARRCISYLTIENKSAIPLELRTAIGNWIFGCDECQRVCPWNRFADPEGHPALAPQAPQTDQALREELKLDAVAFAERFRRRAVKRAKRRGYLRNVAVALGNCGTPEDLPALEQALQEENDPLLCEHLNWAIQQIRHRHALPGISSHEPAASTGHE
uniref:Epoxyqueuosine reductase n=1 Tax=uncultured Chloroflexota bacterium TaxID=166587 RepID=H5SER1_9CHLR|nr:Fe-S cluster binding protein [uncultured Chloroflexota bacterium]